MAEQLPAGSLETADPATAMPKNMDLRVRRKRCFLARALNSILRLAVWYLIITAVFRCPQSASDLSESSPAVCSPYLTLKDYSSPYISPYYDAYLAPHVEKIQPYASRLNQKVISPVVAATKENYDAHAAPVLERAHSYLTAEWETHVQPRVDVTKAEIKVRYQRSLEPYVQTASEVGSPYVVYLWEQSQRGWYNIVVPSYQYATPHVQRGYAGSTKYFSDTILPHMIAGKDAVVLYFNRVVVPKVKVLYAEHVEPQLVRIQDHLVHSKEGKVVSASKTRLVSSSVYQLKSEDSSLASASVKDTATSKTQTAESSTVDSYALTETVQVGSKVRPAPESTSTPEYVKNKVDEDIRRWQARVRKSMSKMTDDLDDQIWTILQKQHADYIDGSGARNIELLDLAQDMYLGDAKKGINNAVRQLPEEPTEQQMKDAYSHVDRLLSEALNGFRSKAVDLRGWKSRFVADTDSRIDHIAHRAFGVVENIRNLGLEEIGRQWAVLDDVPYEAWTRYQVLKEEGSASLRQEAISYAFGHKKYSEIMEHASTIESRILDLSEKFVEEARRLRNVSRWKLHLADSSDDFSSRDPPKFVSREEKEKAREEERARKEAAEAEEARQAAIREEQAQKARLEAAEQVPMSLNIEDERHEIYGVDFDSETVVADEKKDDLDKEERVSLSGVVVQTVPVVQV